MFMAILAASPVQPCRLSGLRMVVSGSLHRRLRCPVVSARLLQNVRPQPLLDRTIAEELAFRGFLLRRLVAEDFEAVPSGRFTWPALLLSSVAFGALHGSRWIAGTLAGLLRLGHDPQG